MNAHAPLDTSVGRFRLLRYFMLTSLVAFSLVGIALYMLQRSEEDFFARVQDEQTRFFAQVQRSLADQQAKDVQSGLVAVHETSHVNLTRVFANVLWEPYIAPLMRATRRIDVDRCRSMRDSPGEPAAQRRACFAAMGAAIRALPEFVALDTHARATMHGTSVFKIKVYDLRGITVYSSESVQVGEDKADNAGWRDAVRGKAASELTHRDRFSAFEGVVENRDLIQSYIPVQDQAAGDIVGVFEIYSDVTPLLAQMRQATERIALVTQANQAQVESAARANEHKVHESSGELFLIVGGLLAVLYLALLLLVRIGQRIIDRQAAAQRTSLEREHLWHRDKMAALAAMADNVSHELGNALEIISGEAQELGHHAQDESSRAERVQRILLATWRISDMARRMVHFASAGRGAPEPVSVKDRLVAICDFMRYDRRFHNMKIELTPLDEPAIALITPDHLNEALINVLQAFMPGEPGTHGTARIAVEMRRADVNLDIVFSREAAALAAGDAPAPDPLRDARLESARRRIEAAGGTVRAMNGHVTVTVPLTPRAASTMELSPLHSAA